MFRDRVGKRSGSLSSPFFREAVLLLPMGQEPRSCSRARAEQQERGWQGKKRRGFARPRGSRRGDADPLFRIRIDPARAEDQRDNVRKDGETVFFIARGRGQRSFSLTGETKVDRFGGRHSWSDCQRGREPTCLHAGRLPGD
ncbi:hypothetical protein F9L04_24390 [Brucella anthropi]|uniref:Uncharacterized protein n=1 Tax=Brucella anthropi TaxID=529 RepID=A0A6L3YZT9_BRUAN|nr:hypothetical protein F9L04_24390 [Brucella anthropi]